MTGAAAEPTYSVIVVLWNNLETTVRCVESLMRTAPPDAELIFVDNGSTDGTRGYLAEVTSRAPIPCKTVLADRNEGWCRGINLGLERALGDYVVFLNNDVITTPGWLEGLRECLVESPTTVPGLRRVGLVGPVTNSAGGPQQVVGPIQYDLAGLDDHARRHREVFRKSWGSSFFLSGFCLMIRRGCLHEVGGLDERFSPGGFDDNDIVLRAQELGWDAVIAGDVFVHHDGSSTFRRLLPANRSGLVNRAVFYDKWRERRAGPKRLVAIYRVKNCEAMLKESLDATARFADAIVVLDDGSTDGTGALCERHPAVTRYERQDLPFQERRDRNRLLAMASELRPDWVIAIDADEVFEMDRARVERLMHLNDPHVRVLGFHWYTFWEPTRTYYRSDGIFGGMSGYRMFRWEPGQHIAHGTANGLHCGNIPHFPDGAGRYTDVRVRHLGYDSEELRRRKHRFYRELDPQPDASLVGNSDYAHLVSTSIWLRRYPERHGVSLCVITKNEEERLEEFLSFFEPYVDQICVVDTGSTDRTAEIARRFTENVEILAMDRLDLAHARNRSVALATQPWILSLDPDESIALSDLPNLHRLLDDQEAHAYTFHVSNHQKDGPPVMSLAVRLFRNDPKIRYSRPVHETVEQSLMVYAGVVVRPSHIALEHHGYLKDDAVVEAKMVRYFERNREYREEHPEDPMPWFNEAMHLLNEGREEEAASFLSRATRLDPGFLSPRSQLAYLFQERAMRSWQSVLEAMPADHPLRPQAERSLNALSAMTPPRPPVGKARSG